MTAEKATQECLELLKAFGLHDWTAWVCSNSAIASVNNGKAEGRDGGQLQGLTCFNIRAIFLSETYCEDDSQAWELIEHEVAHALSGDPECANSLRFDAAVKRIDTFYRDAECQSK